MIVQFVIQLIPVIITGFLTFMVCKLVGTAVRYCGSGVLGDLYWMLPNTPALNEFIMFVLQSAIAVTALVSTLLQVSNHIIISLDILYLFSLCMLILFHTIKEAVSLQGISLV